jgi:hypothetical protein
MAGLLAVTDAAAADRACAITGLVGTATIQSGVRATKAVIGMALPRGAIVETGGRSQVEVRCDDGITVTVGFKSRLATAGLVGPSGKKRGLLMRLYDGIVGIDAPERTWRSFEVETDLAIASVRSTAWIVVSDPREGTDVFVRRGAVAVRSGRAATTLAAGEGVDVSPSEGMQPVVRWGKRRIRETGRTLGFGWNVR